jgi:hypothetical protein
MDSGALGTSGGWRTQVDQAKVYSRASRLRKNSMGWSIDGFQLMVVASVGIAGSVFSVDPVALGSMS